MTTAAGWLRAKAESYGSDASKFHGMGDKDLALIYRSIRDHLRQCADEIEREVT